MPHTHGHSHQTSHGKAFAIGILLNIVFVVIEVFYGFTANSSALLADAGHNASDVLSLIFAWTAAWLATIRPKGKYTYGLRKTTILVSILNALLLFGAAFAIGWDAVGKFNNPEPVAGNQIMIVAAIGVVINTFTALLFMKGQKEDLNIKGAFLHMAADAGISLGVVIAGLLILTTNILWIDPLMSLLIIAVILWSTWKLFIDAINLALDAVPKNININEVKDFLVTNKDVENVHDLHVWALSTTENALSAHVIAVDNCTDKLLVEIQNGLRKKFGIVHTTIQIEKKDQNDLNCINCD